MTSDGNMMDDARASLGRLVDDAERLLAVVGEEGSARYRDAVAGLKRQVRRARDDLADLQYSAMRQARASAREADRYVHDHPYRSAGAAALAGVAIGAVLVFILSRR